MVNRGALILKLDATSTKSVSMDECLLCVPSIRLASLPIISWSLVSCLLSLMLVPVAAELVVVLARRRYNRESGKLATVEFQPRVLLAVQQSVVVGIVSHAIVPAVPLVG